MIASLLIMAAAAAPNPPVVGLFSAEDYPPRAMARMEEGSVAFEALVSPDGRVDRCSIIISSHYDDLDDATCRLVKARARFAPADDGNGKPIYGIYRSITTWSLGDAVPAAMLPDLELQVNAAPTGVQLPVTIKMSYLTRADGTATNCHPAPSKAPISQILADLACKAILAQPPQVIRNSSGQAVESTNNMVVRFTLGSN